MMMITIRATGQANAIIHVVDLADAHLAVLDYSGAAQGCEAINVEASRRITVMALIAAYERACGHSSAT